AAAKESAVARSRYQDRWAMGGGCCSAPTVVVLMFGHGSPSWSPRLAGVRDGVRSVAWRSPPSGSHKEHLKQATRRGRTCLAAAALLRAGQREPLMADQCGHTASRIRVGQSGGMP